MTTIELAKKALSKFEEQNFCVNVYASEGGKCGGGWDNTHNLYLSKAQFVYLLKQQIDYEELFVDMPEERIDIDDVIYNMAYDGAWPNGGPTPSVNDVIPYELRDIDEELEQLDTNDTDAVKEIREKLLSISDGKYTFSFTISAGGYYFTEDAEETLTLSAKQAQELLYAKYGYEKVFDGICDEGLDENFLDDEAIVKNFAGDYDCFSYGGESEELEAFLNAWEYIIENIISGEITEEKLDNWMEYFNDYDNYKYDIVDWFEERDEE